MSKPWRNGHLDEASSTPVAKIVGTTGSSGGPNAALVNEADHGYASVYGGYLYDTVEASQTEASALRAQLPTCGDPPSQGNGQSRDLGCVDTHIPAV